MIKSLQRNWNADEWLLVSLNDFSKLLDIITFPAAPEITYHAEIDGALQDQHKIRVIHRHGEMEKGIIIQPYWHTD